MKKLIGLLLITILIIAALPISFSAVPTAGEQLKTMGLLTGDQYGDLAESKYLTRTEMMVILARMLGDYDSAFKWTRVSTFSDKNNHWGERYVAYAQYRGWTVGVGNNRFGYELRHSVQEASVLMLKALGYTAPTDFTWTTAYTKAKSLGLFNTLNLKETNDILRGDLFKVMLNTLYTDVKGQTYRLGEKLEVLEPEMLPFEVKSITAENLKEIEVVFNKQVEEGTLSSSDFVISGRTVTPELLSDGVTVRLLVSSTLSDNTTYSLRISGISATDDTDLSTVSKSFKTDEGKMPSVESVRLLGPEFIEITFDEPIKTAGTLQLYSGTTLYTTATSFEGLGTRTIIADLAKQPVSGSTYTYKVRNFKDYVNYSNESYDIKLIYKPTSLDPVASVKKATQTYVLVEFNKLVTGVTKEHFYHSTSSKMPLEIYTDAAMTHPISETDQVEQIYVKFAERVEDSIVGNPLPAGTVSIHILEENASGNVIEDEYANAYLGGTYSANVVADTSKPQVVKLAVLSTSLDLIKLTVEFNENVAFSEDNIIVSNVDDTDIEGLTMSLDGSGKLYTVELTGTSLIGRTIIVALLNVEDMAISPNVLDLYEKQFVIADKIAPLVSQVTQDTSKKEIYITFNESVSDSAISRYRYEINSNAIDNNPEFYSGNDQIILKLTDVEFETSQTSNAELKILGVKDLAGNIITTTRIKFNDIDDIADPIL